MRVRQFELRIIAVILSVLWLATGLMVLVSYRPGGPADVFVGIAASLPLVVSLAGVVWPPLVRGDRAAAGIIWLGAAAVLLLIPSIAGVVVQIVSRTSEPLLPSLEVVYPWTLALLATGLFAGLGITRRATSDNSLGRRRVVGSVAFAVLATVAIGGLFAGASLANDAALRNKPAQYSRFGPTGSTREPPACGGTLRTASTAHLALNAHVAVDFRSAGDLSIVGVRSGADVSWKADISSPDYVGPAGVVRIGSSGWQQVPRATWTHVAPSALDNELLDETVMTAVLAPGNRETAEERGLEFVEGARARHCRINVTGEQFEAAFPQIRLLIGDVGLGNWRGQIDYWIFADSEVGMVQGTVNGEASDILPHGIQATAQATLTATNRDTPVSIQAPR